jgi:hypothetical protein
MHSDLENLANKVRRSWGEPSVVPLGHLRDAATSHGSGHADSREDGRTRPPLTVDITPRLGAEAEPRSSSSPRSCSSDGRSRSMDECMMTPESSDSTSTLSSPVESGAPNLRALQARGTGQHTCPLGKKCDKGGVLPSGELVVFARNCSFRYGGILAFKISVH